MSSQTRRPIYLTHTEREALLQKERNERRKDRLIQVREQEKVFAHQVRENVRRKKEEEKRLLERHIQEHLIKDHQKQLHQLEQALAIHYQQIGQAHRDAMTVEQEEQRLQELRLLLSAQQKAVAKKRQAAAMRELTNNQARDRNTKTEAMFARTRVLAAEKERAKSIATNKQFNSPSLLIMDLEPNPAPHLSTRRVQGIEAFASTYFHLPDNLVQRELTPTPHELNATQAAQQVLIEQQEHQKKATAHRQEQDVKAHLRHKHALAQVKLEKEKVTLLKDLSILARDDRTHRQQVLHQIPANLFQPVQQRLQQQEIQQYELEHAFERLLTCPTQDQLTKLELREVNPRPSSNFPTQDKNTSERQIYSDDLSSSGHPSNSAVELSIDTLTTTCVEPSEESSDNVIAPRHEEKSKKSPQQWEGPQNIVIPTEQIPEERDSLSISTIPPDSIKGSDISSQSTNISKLVEMIRAQQEACQQRASVLKEEEGSPSLKGESLSISTLSSSQGPPDFDTAPTTSTTNSVVPSKISETSHPSLTISTSTNGSHTREEELKPPTPPFPSDTNSPSSPLTTHTNLPSSPTSQSLTNPPSSLLSSCANPHSSLPLPYNTSLSHPSTYINPSLPSYTTPAPYYQPFYYYPNQPWVYSYPWTYSQSYTTPSIIPQHTIQPTGSQSFTLLGQSTTSLCQGSTSAGAQSGSVAIPVSIPLPQAPQTEPVSANTLKSSSFDSPVPSLSILEVTPSPQLKDAVIVEQNHSSLIEHGSYTPSSPVTPNIEERVAVQPFLPSSEERTCYKNERLTDIEEEDEDQLATDDEPTLDIEQRRLFIQSLLASLEDQERNQTPPGSTPHTPFDGIPQQIYPNPKPLVDASSDSRLPQDLLSFSSSEEDIEERKEDITTERQFHQAPSSELIASPSDTLNVQTIESSLKVSSIQIESPLRTPSAQPTSPFRVPSIQTPSQSPFIAPSVQTMSPLQTSSVQIKSSSQNHSEQTDSPLQTPSVPTSVDYPHGKLSSTEQNQLTSQVPQKTQPLSLQEAFQLKKLSFIEQSRLRVNQLEEKAKERAAKYTNKAKTKVVSFSVPPSKANSTGHHTPPVIHKAGPPERLFAHKPEKISAKEMHQRNLRLYNRLPEVQAQKKVALREQEHAKNRERAKIYHQTLRKKMTERRKINK